MPNSLAQSVDLTCANCWHTFFADVWLIVDAAKRPDLLQRLRDGALHDSPCPHCGHAGQVDAPLLLYLPDRNPADDQPPLIFSPAQRTTAEQDQEQANGLLGRLPIVPIMV